MAVGGCRQVVIHLAGHGNTVWTRHEIGAGTAVREHLHSNAGLVHRLQSSLADVGQEFERVRAVRRCLSRPEAPAADCAWIDSVDQGWNRKMLFERYNTHRQFLRLLTYHTQLPSSCVRVAEIAQHPVAHVLCHAAVDVFRRAIFGFRLTRCRNIALVDQLFLGPLEVQAINAYGKEDRTPTDLLLPLFRAQPDVGLFAVRMA